MENNEQNASDKLTELKKQLSLNKECEMKFIKKLELLRDQKSDIIQSIQIEQKKQQTESQLEKSILQINLEDKIGQGACGVVYKLHNYNGIDTVAIKVLNDKENCEEMKKEIEMLENVRNPRCTIMYEVRRASINNEIFMCIVMEYCKNGSLHVFLEGNYMKTLKHSNKLDLSMSFLLDIILGLRYLHSINVVHRDLKTNNLLVTEDYRIKICDFGFAVQVNQLNDRAGTYHWLAPEVLSGSYQTKASDMWAFGLIVYKIFSGQDPFVNQKTISELKYAISSSDEIKNNLKLPAECPHQIQNIILNDCCCIGRRDRTTAEILSQKIFDDWINIFLPSEPSHSSPEEEPQSTHGYDHCYDYNKKWKLFSNGEGYIDIETFLNKFEISKVNVEETKRLIGALFQLKNVDRMHLYMLREILRLFGTTKQYESRENSKKISLSETFDEMKTVLYQPWFRGHITREEASGILQNQPLYTFIIRINTRFSTAPHPFIISYRSKEMICNAFIQRASWGCLFNQINDEYVVVRSHSILYYIQILMKKTELKPINGKENQFAALFESRYNKTDLYGIPIEGEYDDIK